MKFGANNIWDKFKSAFKEIITKYPIQTLEQSWLSKSDRSKFYFGSLLPKIATQLGLEFKTERPFRVDGLFFKRGSQTTEIPVVYIESENHAKSSNEEIYKLCCINAPLKILFICNEWTDTQKIEITNGYWNYIIDDFAEINLLIGNLCVLIAEWNEKLKIYSYCYNNKGVVFEDEILVEV